MTAAGATPAATAEAISVCVRGNSTSLAADQRQEGRLEILTERGAHRVVRVAEPAKRLWIGKARLLHHNRRLDVPFGLSKKVARLIRRRAGHDGDDSARAIFQFFGTGMHIDHQVAV